MAVWVAVAVFGIDYFPREHFNADGSQKLTHKTHAVAIRHRRSLNLTSRVSKHLQVYKCSRCASWHAGNRGPR